ncbi:MAG TPA: hydantoinase/oxoprolinase family protein, partial [Xanthomonadales bacterium]|nr:hydantoinase/oxoprolinase family protein [Xanthomonadales bacterium]
MEPDALNEDKGSLLAGIDTGGTFTDFVILAGGRIRHCKVLSTPDDPSRAIREGLDRLGVGDEAMRVVHGTTVGTNAVLEGKGARVAYVTSVGFADVLTLGRQNREQVYRLRQPPVAPPVEPDLCLEVSTRAAADGSLLARAGEDELAELAARLEALEPEAVAVNLLFSFLCPEEEQRIAEALGQRWFTSLSSRVLPEVREYERGIATWLDASVGPVMARYLGRLAERLPRARISVMQSAGTTITAAQAQAQSQAVRLLLSGPAGGLAAALLVGRVCGTRKLLSFDMGGTSTDVSLLDGEIPLCSANAIGRWPLAVPSVDIHSIGAGGGSIARVDRGGMLLVGPESAGATPGPACYGQGGEDATVTDANLVLGRIPGDTLLGGYLPLDGQAAAAALERLGSDLGCDREEAARGVIRLANEHMARALRVMSVERGHDPRDYALFSFGGAGGLHACELADLLDMPEVIVPAAGGVLSALGMLASEPGRDLSRAVLEDISGLGDPALERMFAELQAEADAQ